LQIEIQNYNQFNFMLGGDTVQLTSVALYCSFVCHSTQTGMGEPVEERLTKLEELFETRFSKVEETNTALQEQAATILRLLQDQKSRTEADTPVAVDDSQVQDGVPRGASNQASQAAVSAQSLGAPCSASSIDIQQEYASVADGVSKIKLHPDFRLNEKGSIKSSLRTHANTIKKCARYTETILKQLSRLEPSNITEQDFADLFLCAHAEIQYLQDEFATLLAESRYGSDTAGVFRDLQTNSSVFSGDRIDRLKSAIELQAAHGRYHENPRGRGRGSYRRPYGNRGGFRNNRDVFQAVTSRNVPHHRPDERQDHDN
jgi:hypothetical protein